MLKINKEFFESLNSSGIRYCHWKSNEHLDAALEGRTDLDVLIDIEDRSGFEQRLAEYRFKKIISPAEKQFPGLEDYLGFDHETGRLVHLHVHYRLVLGQKFIKNHHLPIESCILENLIVRQGIFIPCPELELILLIIRAHMKVDGLSLAKHAIKDFTADRYTAFPAAIENEFSSLIGESDLNRLPYYLSRCDLPLQVRDLNRFIALFSCGRLTAFDVYRLRRKIMRVLADYRRSRDISIPFRYWYFVVADWRVVRRFKNVKRKTLDGPGKIISIVGADGSGKSTLVEDLQAWLSWKLHVTTYYYGIPKNPICRWTSISVRMLKKLKLRKIADFVEVHLWLSVARIRRDIALRSQRDAESGKVVVTDRFPLKEFHEMDQPMDGPRLTKIENSAGSSYAEREASIYADIPYPDKVFVLQVDYDELRKRKSDLDADTHRLKAFAVSGIGCGEGFELIDANQSYDDVLLEIKRNIWQLL